MKIFREQRHGFLCIVFLSIGTLGVILSAIILANSPVFQPNVEIRVLKADKVQDVFKAPNFSPYGKDLIVVNGDCTFVTENLVCPSCGLKKSDDFLGNG